MKNVPALLLIVLLAAACQSKGKSDVSLRLTHHERARIDTLYNERVKDLRPAIDSLCELRKPAMIQAALDSILEERARAEERLRNRPSHVDYED
jgi:hypothetical protein